MSVNEKELTKLTLLKERHQQLDDEADEMSARPWLSSSDQVKLKELKVRRLRLRDLIDEIEQEDGS
tara:strand:- start:239 stop:436 length:198 start_codon:yes stop_codon:yes gene_type:complete